jgi:queuosine precursor transporter
VNQRQGLALLICAMILIVASANYLVQFPVSDWLTWGAITYPISYFITDLANRWYGPARARRVVYVGFVLAVLLSIWLASPRIALASGLAFLVSQLMDVAIFDRMRGRRWWQPPLVSSVLGSLVDTALFFFLAFYATGMPWVTLAIGDYGVKVAIALLLLLPWRLTARRG